MPRAETPVNLPRTLTLPWVQSHLDLRPALKAYTMGIEKFGETIYPSTLDQIRKSALSISKIKINHSCDSDSPIQDDDIYNTIALFPEDWIKAAALDNIELRTPALFVVTQYGNNYFVAGLQTHMGDVYYFNDQPIGNADKLQKHYSKNGYVAPQGDEHYAPGQYLDKKRALVIWDPPPSIRNQFSGETLRQYGRELITHELIHGVLRSDSANTFIIDGVERDYAFLMEDFYHICLEETESVSRYAELYAPLLKRDYDKEDFWVKSALQEELGELISSYLLGWGSRPDAEPQSVLERDFGGKQFSEKGISKKVEFIEKLLRAKIKITEG